MEGEGQPFAKYCISVQPSAILKIKKPASLADGLRETDRNLSSITNLQSVKNYLKILFFLFLLLTLHSYLFTRESSFHYNHLSFIYFLIFIKYVLKSNLLILLEESKYES